MSKSKLKINTNLAVAITNQFLSPVNCLMPCDEISDVIPPIPPAKFQKLTADTARVLVEKIQSDEDIKGIEMIINNRVKKCNPSNENYELVIALVKEIKSKITA